MQIYDIAEPKNTNMERSIPIGIDFGTTNSLVATIKEGKPVVLNIGIDKSNLMPSTIKRESNGDVIVGLEENLGLERSIKRLIGANDQEVITSASYIIGAIKHNAEALLGCEITNAVVTVPAHFNDMARMEVKKAANMCGINILRIINEPTAAGIAYGLNHKANGTYIVYDMGGGTFDVSVIKFTDGIFHVLATAGDSRLGGDDFDMLIFENLKSKYDGFKISAIESRRIKEWLSNHEVWVSQSDDTMSLSKQEFVELIMPHVKHSIKMTIKAISSALVEIEDISGVLLVGGSTRVPCIRSELEKVFGTDKLLSYIDPDCVVVMGAAIQCGVIMGVVRDSTLIDVVSGAIALELRNGSVEVLIPSNTQLPAQSYKRYATAADCQSGFVIHLLQSAGDMEKYVTICKFEMTGLPALPAGQLQIDLHVRVDTDGIISIIIENKEYELYKEFFAHTVR